jgi:hypothetical protein
LLLLAAAAADERPADRVTIREEPPLVTVHGLPPGRYSVDLPDLEYALEIDARCADGAAPESLSVTVADTRARLTARELATGPVQRLVLKVPASQTAPLALDDFCPAPPAAAGDGASLPFRPAGEATASAPPLEVPDVLSAQVSLVCGEGEQRRVSWFSRPLAVKLACQPSPASPPPGND